MTEKFLEFAEFLQEQEYFSEKGTEFVEVSQKVAISRAYYGVFHLAKIFADRFSKSLTDKAFDDDTEAIHGKLREFYLNTSMNMKADFAERKHFSNVASHLDRLRTARNICDYQKPIKFNLENRTSQVLSIARKTREDIQKLDIWLDEMLKDKS